MKRKIICLCLVLSVLMLFSGCGLTDGLVSLLLPDMTEAKDLPHLMVSRIEVTMNPYDPAYQRVYETQENLTATLKLLRDMPTMEYPEDEPTLSDGQTYYTITAIYANGSYQEYHILGYRYLKVGDEPWCVISFEQAMEFTQFLMEHQSDDGSYVPPATEPPAETTVPEETGTEPQST